MFSLFSKTKLILESFSYVKNESYYANVTFCLQALETLVKQLNCTNYEVVQHLLSLFQESSVWRYRALAADLLIVLGSNLVE